MIYLQLQLYLRFILSEKQQKQEKCILKKKNLPKYVNGFDRYGDTLFEYFVTIKKENLTLFSFFL